MLRGERVDEGCLWRKKSQLQVSVYHGGLDTKNAPFWGASSASVILLLLVAGASTGAAAAAVMVWVGALLELGVASS